MSNSFETVPNQKIISISNKAPRDTTNIYAKINVEAMLNAMKALTSTNFQVWLYLAKNNDNYTFALSPSAAAAETGMKKSAIQEGIRVLIKEKYLVQRKDNSNVYDFFEIPKKDEQEQEEEMHIHINKQPIKSNLSFNGSLFKNSK